MRSVPARFFQERAIVSAPAITEADVRKVREAKASAEREAAELFEQANTLAASIKASGGDIASSENFGTIDAAYMAADTRKNDAAELGDRLQKMLGWLPGVAAGGDEQKVITTGADGRLRVSTSRAMAERFMANEAYQRVKSSLASEAAIGNLGVIEVATRDETEAWLAVAGEAPHGNLVPEDQRLAMPVMMPLRRVRIFDLISNLTTDSDLVEWAKEITPSGNDITGTAAVRDAATETAYGTAAPRSTYAFDRQTTPVARIPAETVATKGNLADASQLAGILRTKLSDNLIRVAEARVVKGSGSGSELRGIVNTSGIGALTLGGGERRIEAIHRCVTNIRVNLEDEPTGIGIHPSTWEEVIFEKDGNGVYILPNNVREAVQPVLWGLPVVISTVFTVDTSLVGRWTYSEWYLRQGITVNAYDQHADFASKGLVLMVGELRAAHVVPQPKAFCVVTGL
jgi:hypothetical protein